MYYFDSYLPAQSGLVSAITNSIIIIFILPFIVTGLSKEDRLIIDRTQENLNRMCDFPKFRNPKPKR